MDTPTKDDEPRHLQLFGIFWREMLKESDRGFVLIAAGYLEELLKGLILAQLVEGTKESDFPWQFSSRAKLARGLGVITEQELHDLRILGEIRNDFAHELDVSFQIPEIIAKCRNMKINAGCKGDPFMQMKMACLLLITGLQKRIAKVEERRLKPMEISNPLDVVKDLFPQHNEA